MTTVGLTEAEAEAVRPVLAGASDSARAMLEDWQDDRFREDADDKRGAMIAYWRARLAALAKLTAGLQRKGA